jgi:hypothetical protein
METVTRETRNRTAVALLVGAPLLMAIGRLLLVPFDDQGWDGVLTAAAGHQTRSDTGWILAIAACGLLGAGSVFMANLLRRAGRTKAAAFATVAVPVGWAGTAAICGGGLMLSYQGKVVDRAAQIQLLKEFNAGDSGFVFLLCVVAVVGYIVLALGLARGHLVSKGAAVLIGLGGAGTLLTMAGPVKPLLVAAALVLLAGQAMLLRAGALNSLAVPADPDRSSTQTDLSADGLGRGALLPADPLPAETH